MRVQQGLEGPPDLRPLPRSVLWMGQTHTYAHKKHNRMKSHQPTRGYDLLFPMVERAEGLVSVMCFPQRAFGSSSSFSVTLHVAAPSPRAAFFYLQVQSSLCPLVLSSMQFYSVSSPPPPHLHLCILLPLPAYIHPPSPAFCMADHHHHPNPVHRLPPPPVCHIISTDAINPTETVIRIGKK